ncbi:hypothetical protein Ddye_025397 [Dipteronia dyeriana]|uniref:TF-B3 domain-containing protein n=1 Tax=Dipteronia dyeriana TaxID=168575 RepID=A0AAD9TKS8_9ROSI|nr:hypothetical protein Ddye_025397 [Dipteronia dyeriana]
MAIFKRMLTRYDIESRLTILRYCVGAFPAVQESQAVDLKVKDETGHVWTFRCSLRSAISPRLVFCSRWRRFASSKHLHVGDTIIIHREVDQDNTAAPYKIEVIKNHNNILSMSGKVEANERLPHRISV